MSAFLYMIGLRGAILKYALIGCGRIAENHIKAALENHLDVTAVCDLLPRQMDSLLHSQGLSKQNTACYTDYRELLRQQPELVAIATESGSHAEIALACIEQGIPVIIEKPIALRLTDAREIARRGREKSVAVAVCHQNRFNRAVQQMRGALEEGRFGQLSHGTVHVRWARNQDYYTQAPWRGTWAQDGGALMNQCIHGIDLLRWMMGDEIDTVYGATRRRFHSYIEAEDTGLAIVQFKNGAIGSVEGTVNVYPRNLEETLYLFGDKGTVKLGGMAVNQVDVWNFADGRDSLDATSTGEEVINVYGNGHGPLYADMVQAIQLGRAPYVTAEAGARALELVLAIYKSQRTGLPVQFPMEDFSTLDMEGAFG